MSSARLKVAGSNSKVPKSGHKAGGSDHSFDLLSDVVPGRESWRFMLRVVRVWEVPAFLHPEQINSIEMVLVDEKGVKIHATVRKQLLYLFQKKLVEGQVYKMSYFSVAPSIGSYRTTAHAYKLFFQMKTKVNVCEGSLLPLYGLNLTKIDEIVSQTLDSDFLIDVVGLMTGISDEREYIRDGKVTKMVLLQITDQSGKCEIALFGDYVDHLKHLMAKGVKGLPVLVMQFAKVKIFRDVASLQNVMSTTRILLNPEIAEVVDFKKGLDSHPIGGGSSVPIIGPRGRPPLAEDFLRLYPKKTIAELKELGENETFIVCAVVDDLVEGEDWWYPACKCHRSVTPDSGAYYCKGCVRHVFHIVPRFKVKLRVSDESDEAVFVVFDTDMQLLLDKQCTSLVEAAKAENAGFVPSELDNLKGKKILFKVMTGSGTSSAYDGSFRVRRVCIDEAIFELFLADEEIYTPSKVSPISLDDVAAESEKPAASIDPSQIDEFVPSTLLTPDLDDDDTPVSVSSIISSKRKSSKRNLSKTFDEAAEASSGKAAKQAKAVK